MTSNHNIGFHFKRKLLFSRIYSLQKLSIKADLKVAFVKTKAKLLKKTGKAVYQLQTCNCVKSVRTGSYSSTYFPAFGLNTAKYGYSETPNTNTFYAVCNFNVQQKCPDELFKHLP